MKTRRSCESVSLALLPKLYFSASLTKSSVKALPHLVHLPLPAFCPPPFYATKIEAVILVCVGGLKINTDLQVLKEDGTPIEGLYATGNTSGDLYAVDYPINMPGNSNGRCLTWGYMLGDILAKN